MQFGTTCTVCLIKRQADFARRHGDNAQVLAFIKDVMQALIDAPAGVAAPYFSPVFDRLAEKHFGVTGDRYRQVKEESNRFMLARLGALREAVFSAPDPLRMALQFARTGNYIDFGALHDSMRYDELDALLARAKDDIIEETEYRKFRDELSHAKKMLYLCDNAGEIVIDRVVAEVLRAEFPKLSPVFCVRGGPALNDALRDDAYAAGLDRFAEVIDSGSNMSGTELAYVGADLLKALAEAEVVLAKGMGNFETMWGCGKNVYYLFLCKCPRFQQMFGVPRLTGMFVNENRLQLQPFYD